MAWGGNKRAMKKNRVFKLKNIGNDTIHFLFGSVEPGENLILEDRYLAKSLALLLPRQLVLQDECRQKNSVKNDHGSANA